MRILLPLCVSSGTATGAASASTADTAAINVGVDISSRISHLICCWLIGHVSFASCSRRLHVTVSAADSAPEAAWHAVAAGLAGVTHTQLEVCSMLSFSLFATPERQ
jgi:hypothetical protein